MARRRSKKPPTPNKQFCQMLSAMAYRFCSAKMFANSRSHTCLLRSCAIGDGQVGFLLVLTRPLRSINGFAEWAAKALFGRNLPLNFGASEKR